MPQASNFKKYGYSNTSIHFDSRKGKISAEADGEDLQHSQGNFSHAYTNMMKENFKQEDFESEISLSNMSHATLRSSLFPETAFVNTYKDLWNGNQMPYWLFETSAMSGVNTAYPPTKTRVLRFPPAFPSNIQSEIFLVDSADQKNVP